MFDVTILGAGPTGLTAALALLREGCRVRILERNTATTGESRAVGVNRRSLRHLEKVGAAAPILAEAETLRRVRLHVNDRVLTTLPIPQPPSGPPAMVALPQSRTEAILAGLLRERGVPIAFGTAAEAVTQEAGRALVRATGPEGPLEIASDYVLGADGSRSITRKALGLSFPGERYEGDWALFDAVLDWPWPDVQAGVWLKDPGDVMLAITLGDGRHRIIGTADRLEERMRAIMPVGDISWRNAFTLSERRVERYGGGRIWLAGDAAHIHSPVGGMGMNLGIDDAFDFAASLVAGDLAGYERRRLAAATRVMETADRGFRLITSRNPLMRVLRNTALRAVGASGLLQRWLARRVFAANA